MERAPDSALLGFRDPPAEPFSTSGSLRGTPNTAQSSNRGNVNVSAIESPLISAPPHAHMASMTPQIDSSDALRMEKERAERAISNDQHSRRERERAERALNDSENERRTLAMDLGFSFLYTLFFIS